MNKRKITQITNPSFCNKCGSCRIVEQRAVSKRIDYENGSVTNEIYSEPICLNCKETSKITSPEDFAQRKSAKLIKTYTSLVTQKDKIVCAICGSENVNEGRLVSINVNHGSVVNDEFIDHYCEDCEDITSIVWEHEFLS